MRHNEHTELGFQQAVAMKWGGSKPIVAFIISVIPWVLIQLMSSRCLKWWTTHCSFMFFMEKTSGNLIWQTLDELWWMIWSTDLKVAEIKAIWVWFPIYKPIMPVMSQWGHNNSSRLVDAMLIYCKKKHCPTSQLYQRLPVASDSPTPKTAPTLIIKATTIICQIADITLVTFRSHVYINTIYCSADSWFLGLKKSPRYLAAKSPSIFAKLTNVKLAMKSGPSESLMFKHDFSSTALKFKRLTENGHGVFRISFPGYVTICRGYLEGILHHFETAK